MEIFIDISKLCLIFCFSGLGNGEDVQVAITVWHTQSQLLERLRQELEASLAARRTSPKAAWGDEGIFLKSQQR